MSATVSYIVVTNLKKMVDFSSLSWVARKAGLYATSFYIDATRLLSLGHNYYYFLPEIDYQLMPV